MKNLHYFPSYSDICSYWKNSLRTQERIRINHGKRAIGGRAIEVLLYIKQRFFFFFFLHIW